VPFDRIIQQPGRIAATATWWAKVIVATVVACRDRGSVLILSTARHERVSKIA
jgi:hypothetical protein